MLQLRHQLLHKTAAEAADSAIAPEEIDPKYRWNLEDIYQNWEQWENDYAQLDRIIERLESYQGTLEQGPEQLYNYLQLTDDAGRLFDKVWYYPALAFDLDQRNNESNARRQRVEDLSSRYSTATAWFDPEVIALGWETIDRWLNEHDDLALYRFHLEELFRQAEHVLDGKGEHLLALSTRFSGTISHTYSMITTADAKFPEIQLSDGISRKITPGSYSSLLRTLERQDDREKVFRAHFERYSELANTFASIYNSVLQRGRFVSRAREYNSRLEMKLHRNAIPVKVVETLVNTARKGMGPIRRYHELRRKTLNLDKYYLYDGFAPLIEHDTRYTFDEAADSFTASVAPLGQEYQQRATEAFRKRWVDAYEFEGKRSGGYMASVYGVHPFILMNYHDTLDDVFTLAHEMGHALHSVLSDETQPFTYAGYTIFIAEVASTLNEALLLDELLKRARNPEEKIVLLQHAIDSIAGTFYTQSLFANYELEAHKVAEAGDPITAEVLNDIYHNLLASWYGDAFNHEHLYRFTWARIPHFYHSPYYVYQYATSFASSAAIHNRMKSAEGENERKQVVDRYLELLRSGGSDQPMKLLQRAGVDLNQPDPVEAVVKRTDELVTQLEQELKEL